MSKKSATYSLLASSALLTVLCAPAVSQEPVSEAENQKGEQVEFLDAIIVTATKRSETIDDLSTAVTVRTIEGELDNSPLSGEALARSAPNFNFAGFGQPGVDFVTMRGIGTLGQPSNSLDNTVGFATDGVPTSAFGFPPSLLDVKQIEILRGPQGTLFGRNSMGGLVNVVTNQADGDRIFKARGEVGTKGHWLAEAIAGGWLKENLIAGRVAARWQKQDGDIENDQVGKKEGGAEIAAVRGSFRLTPDDDFTADLTLGFDRNERNLSYNMLLEHPRDPISGSDRFPMSRRDRMEATLKIAKIFETIELTSISNIQKMDITQRISTADNHLFQKAFGFTTPKGSNDADIDQDELIFNQEFRVSSLPEDDLSWVAGASYFRSSYKSVNDQVSSYSPYGSGLFNTKITAQTFALFGDMTVPVHDRLRLSAGLRVAHDDQEFDATYKSKGFPGTVANYSQTASLSDTYVTGRVSASFDVTDDLMTYASISHGYGSGGFQRFPINLAVGMDAKSFSPSTIWSAEIGAKMHVLDDIGHIAVNGFYNRVKDGQMIAANMNTTPVTFAFIAQDYESYGFEIEADAQIGETFSIAASLGVTESRLINVGANAPAGVNAGNRVPNSPDLTASLQATWQLLEDITATASYNYVGQRAMEAQNSGFLDAYNIVNGKISWEKDGLNIYAFGNNLLDERPRYFGGTYSSTAHSVVTGPGRVMGIGLSREF